MKKIDSLKKAGVMAVVAAESIHGGTCDSCQHRSCTACDQCSVQQGYSDYWICHSCGGLNPRARYLH